MSLIVFIMLLFLANIISTSLFLVLGVILSRKKICESPGRTVVINTIVVGLLGGCLIFPFVILYELVSPQLSKFAAWIVKIATPPDEK